MGWRSFCSTVEGTAFRLLYLFGWYSFATRTKKINFSTKQGGCQRRRRAVILTVGGVLSTCNYDDNMDDNMTTGDSHRPPRFQPRGLKIPRTWCHLGVKPSPRPDEQESACGITEEHVSLTSPISRLHSSGSGVTRPERTQAESVGCNSILTFDPRNSHCIQGVRGRYLLNRRMWLVCKYSYDLFNVFSVVDILGLFFFVPISTANVYIWILVYKPRCVNKE